MEFSFHMEGNADEPGRYEYKVERWEQPVVEEDWDFSCQWDFDPRPPGQPQSQPGSGAADHKYSLNPTLNMIHNFMLLERVFLGSGYLASMLSAHIPHYVVGVDEAIGAGSVWCSPNWLTVIPGLGPAGLALWGAVWLPCCRFEL
jgi:hypothetical protein